MKIILLDGNPYWLFGLCYAYCQLISDLFRGYSQELGAQVVRNEVRLMSSPLLSSDCCVRAVEFVSIATKAAIFVYERCV